MKNFRLFALPLLAACVLVPAATRAQPVTSPDDLCAPDADPCVITRRVVIGQASYLDFGLRTVVVAKGAKVITSDSYLSIDCGGFVVEEGATVDLSGRDEDFGGGYLDLTVLGRCDNAPTVACEDASDCPGSQCGGGNLSLLGRVSGRARSFAFFRAAAAGDVWIDGRLNFSARAGGDGAGGYLEIEAQGSVEMRGRFRGRGNGYGGTGSYIDLAGEDVRVVDVDIDVTGQDLDGGALIVTASNDAFFSGSFRGSSRLGGGFGGYLDIIAGRDVLIDGRTDGKPSILEMNGHSSGGTFGFDGDGGEVYLDANRDLVLASNVIIDAKGGPSATGGTLVIGAARNTTIDATIDTTTRGELGIGGELRLTGGSGTLTVGPNASIVLDGYLSGGDFRVRAPGPVVFEGTVSVASGKTSPGSIDIASSDDVRVSGTLRTSAHPVTYRPDTTIWLEGCDISVVDGGLVSMESNGWKTRLTARESLLVDAASSVVAPGAVSSIEIIYRDPLQPPLLLGTVSPTPTLTLKETLTPCL